MVVIMYEQDTPRRATRGQQQSTTSTSTPTISESSDAGKTVEWWLFGLLGLVAGLLALTAIVSWNLSEGASNDSERLTADPKGGADPASVEKNSVVGDDSQNTQAKPEQTADLQVEIDEILDVAPLKFDASSNVVESTSEAQVKMLAQVLKANPDRSLRIYSEPRRAANHEALLSKAAQLKVALEGYGISSSQIKVDDETPERAVELEVE